MSAENQEKDDALHRAEEKNLRCAQIFADGARSYHQDAGEQRGATPGCGGCRGNHAVLLETRAGFGGVDALLLAVPVVIVSSKRGTLRRVLGVSGKYLRPGPAVP